MDTDVTPERQRAHALLDLLPQEKLTAVVHLLEAISDPPARSLAVFVLAGTNLLNCSIRNLDRWS
jgi:hypothetical protein